MGLFDSLFKGKETAKKAGTQEKLNVDDSEFLIRDGRLCEYRGNSDVVDVPEGVTAIFVLESEGRPAVLRDKKRVILPRSLLYIGNDGIRYVEEICYRGTEAEWQKIDIKADRENLDMGICDSWREVAGGPLIKTRYRYNWGE